MDNTATDVTVTMLKPHCSCSTAARQHVLPHRCITIRPIRMRTAYMA